MRPKKTGETRPLIVLHLSMGHCHNASAWSNLLAVVGQFYVAARSVQLDERGAILTRGSECA